MLLNKINVQPRETDKSYVYEYGFEQEELYLSFPVKANVVVSTGEPKIFIQSASELYITSSENTAVFSMGIAEHAQVEQSSVQITISVPKEHAERLWLRLGYGSIQIDSVCIGDLHIEGGNLDVCVGTGCCIPKFSLHAKHGDCKFTDGMKADSCAVSISNGTASIPLKEFNGKKQLGLNIGTVSYGGLNVRVSDFELTEKGRTDASLTVLLKTGILNLG